MPSSLQPNDRQNGEDFDDRRPPRDPRRINLFPPQAQRRPVRRSLLPELAIAEANPTGQQQLNGNPPPRHQVRRNLLEDYEGDALRMTPPRRRMEEPVQQAATRFTDPLRTPLTPALLISRIRENHHPVAGHHHAPIALRQEQVTLEELRTLALTQQGYVLNILHLPGNMQHYFPDFDSNADTLTTFIAEIEHAWNQRYHGDRGANLVTDYLSSLIQQPTAADTPLSTEWQEFLSDTDESDSEKEAQEIPKKRQKK